MRHAPAGRRIAADVWTRADAPRWSPVRTRYFDSATAALAVAIEEELGGSSDERVVRLPAYACPNLVAATVHAGARPLFVDFLPGGALPTLTEMIGPGAGVAVAVDFCGVPTPAGSGPRSAGRLVHDLAQSFAPFMPGWQPLTSRSVVSFGRAKPVSLTRGGALLGGEAPARARDAVEPGGFALRARAYNLSLNPLAFGVLARLPFLGIGATVYHELDEVRAFGEAFAARARFCSGGGIQPAVRRGRTSSRIAAVASAGDARRCRGRATFRGTRCALRGLAPLPEDTPGDPRYFKRGGAAALAPCVAAVAHAGHAAHARSSRR